MPARRRSRISGQWNARTIEMMESPAYRTMSVSAHRVVDRVCIELAHHGGNDNGKLPVTYDNFENYGMDRGAIAPAIREAVALGFLEVTQRGKGGAGDGLPNLFRVPWATCLGPTPTHPWRKIETMEQALAIARAARKDSAKPRQRRSVVFPAVQIAQ